MVKCQMQVRTEPNRVDPMIPVCRLLGKHRQNTRKIKKLRSTDLQVSPSLE
jgi:hypothetical protein